MVEALMKHRDQLESLDRSAQIMAQNVVNTENSIAIKAALLVLETEASVRLAFPGEFLGYDGPCGLAEKAVSSEVDLLVRSAAKSVHDRARESAICLRNLRRLSDGIASLELPPQTIGAGGTAIKTAVQALGEAEQAVEATVKDLHADLWAALPPQAEHKFAATLLDRLDILGKTASRTEDKKIALDAWEEWHRAAEIVRWWSGVAPNAFLRAGFEVDRHLRPLPGNFELHDHLAIGR